MALKPTLAFLLFSAFILTRLQLNAQSVRGKVIYISASQAVKLKFRSAVNNYSFVNKNESNLFKIKLPGNRNFLINSIGQNFRTANLVITEGENTHLFILAYKDKLDEATETMYDFSTREKLQQETQKMIAGIKGVPAKDTFVRYTTSDPNNITVTQAVNKNEAKPTQKDFNTEYTDLVALADKAYINRNLDEANGLYTAVLILKPNDPWCVFRLNAIQNARDSLKLKNPAVVVKPGAKNPVKPADNTSKSKSAPSNEILYNKEINKANKAFQAKDYVRARTFFEAAQKLNPAEKYPGEKIAAIDALLTQAKELAQAQTTGKALKENTDKQYNLLIKHGKTAMASGDYEIARGFFYQAKDLKQTETFPAAQMEVIDARLLQIKDSIKYDLIIHLADSTAWTAKDYNTALKWYDSAQKIKPLTTYPTKQIRAVKQLRLEKEQALARQQHTAAFNRAMVYFRKADALRVERKYEEAYKGFSEFLDQIDSANLSTCMSSELHYINQAKDYMIRLQNYVPKPAVENTVKPVVNEDKKRKRKKKG